MEELLRTLNDFGATLWIWPFLGKTNEGTPTVVWHFRIYEDEDGILVTDSHLRDITKLESFAQRMLIEFHRKAEKTGWLPRSVTNGERSH